MQLNEILNSSNDFKVLQEEAKRLSNKWESSGLLEGLETEIERNNMARLLDNQAKHIVTEANATGTGGSFSPGQGEQWAGVALPLVRKVFAEFSAQDFVSVQPMNLPSGLVFYLDFKYGTDQAGFGAGDNMYGNASTYNNKMAVDEEVNGGLYGAGRFGYSINEQTADLVAATDGANSLRAATLADLGYEDGATPGDYEVLEVSLAGTDFDSKGVRAFRLEDGAGNAIATRNEFTKTSGDNVYFVIPSGTYGAIATPTYVGNVLYHKQPKDNARGDFEDRDSANPIQIPEIEVELGSEGIIAKTRKLKAKWTPEFSQDLNAYHSIDAEAELTSLLSDYIAMEIDLEILDMLIQDAATTERWSAENNKVFNNATGAWVTDTSDFFNTQGQWFGTLGTKMQKVSNKIHTKTLRGGANFAVVSPDVATVLESIPGYAADTDGDKMDFAMGVQKAGKLNSRFRIYKNPYMTENTMLLGFRGSQFLEAGAVYAPYIPLIMTPLVYDPETFTPRKGVMTRYAKKMVRPEFYGRIFISDLANV